MNMSKLLPIVGKRLPSFFS